MSKIESLILGIFFGFVPVVFFLPVTVVIASILFGTQALDPWVLWSFIPAAIINILLLKKWVRGAYQMNGKALASVYLFYSIIGLGMCMGIPLVSFTLGIADGLYAARKMQLAHNDEQISRRYFKKTAIFSASVMVLMCCLITLWAIAGQMIGYRIETFTITAPIFFAIVLAGGAVAVTLQYLVTLVAAKLAFRFLSAPRKA